MDSEICCCSCTCHLCGDPSSFSTSSITSPSCRSVKRKHDPPKAAEIGSARVEIEIEVAALREAMVSQKLVAQELEAELDEERNAAASAASEAMSMILRLQRERADAVMELRQFKIFADDRMAHDQEEIAALEELISERDHEIESISFELRSCKRRLLNLGIDEDFSNSLQEEDEIYEDEENEVVESVKAEKLTGSQHNDGNGGGNEEEACDRVYTIDAIHEIPMSVQEEETSLKKLSVRLQALEADRESTKQALISLRTEKAQQLLLLRSLSRQLREGTNSVKVVVVNKKKPYGSFIASFFWIIIRWIMSFFSRSKKSTRSRYEFGRPNRNVGLLLLLDNSPRVRQWRSLARSL